MKTGACVLMRGEPPYSQLLQDLTYPPYPPASHSSLNSVNSSDSRSPSALYCHRGSAVPLQPSGRLYSVSSQDSGFVSQDAFPSKSPSPMPPEAVSQVMRVTPGGGGGKLNTGDCTHVLLTRHITSRVPQMYPSPVSPELPGTQAVSEGDPPTPAEKVSLYML